MSQSESHEVLYCRSCGRAAGNGPGQVAPVRYLDINWCPVCAKVAHLPSGLAFVDQPSPGRMYPGRSNDPVDAIHDCYRLTPKRRILIDQAKYEIQRAWVRWDGDKSDSMSMFCFFGWLQKHRPYFLTFRYRGDPWQRVHGWLLQYERGERVYRGEMSVTD